MASRLGQADDALFEAAVQIVMATLTSPSIANGVVVQLSPNLDPAYAITWITDDGCDIEVGRLFVKRVLAIAASMSDERPFSTRCTLRFGNVAVGDQMPSHTGDTFASAIATRAVRLAALTFVVAHEVGHCVTAKTQSVVSATSEEALVDAFALHVTSRMYLGTVGARAARMVRSRLFVL